MIDQVTHEALTRILGTPVDDRSWHQAKPVSIGGLGLRGVENHGSATYAASLLSSQFHTQSLMNHDEVELGPVLEGEELVGNLSPVLAAIGGGKGSGPRGPDSEANEP